MMKLSPKLIPGWPKLAWVARFQQGATSIEVLHGPMLEVPEQWCVEAVWAGEFARGDFDQTDLVCGSGIRCRGDHVEFVSSGTTFDRLIHCRRGQGCYVSNSLPAMLAVGGLALRDDYVFYPRDVESIAAGLERYTRALPVQDGQVEATFFRNLRWDGRELLHVDKPDKTPCFHSFGDYRAFLSDTARRLGTNMSAPERIHRIVPMASVSSGYDSSASAVIAREAGCRDAVTIRQSTSFWRGSDSGLPVAEALGMNSREYDRTAKEYPLEECLWAGTGRPGVMNWTLFDYPDPVCLFFTGWHGEKMWDRVDHDHPDPFIRRDAGPLGFCEFRLMRGVIQCPVPFWGARRNGDLKAITLSADMDPWKTYRDYDKPIARRILKEAGVSGRIFGQVKKNTSQMAAFLWPYSPRCRESFARYLKDRRVACPPSWALPLIRRIAYLDKMVHLNITSRFRIRKSLRDLVDFRGCDLLFQWANAELRDLYDKGLRAAGIDVR